MRLRATARQPGEGKMLGVIPSLPTPPPQEGQRVAPKMKLPRGPWGWKLFTCNMGSSGASRPDVQARKDTRQRWREAEEVCVSGDQVCPAQSTTALSDEPEGHPHTTWEAGWRQAAGPGVTPPLGPRPHLHFPHLLCQHTWKANFTNIFSREFQLRVPGSNPSK